jgi:SAM-dependent methyltransferase
MSRWRFFRKADKRREELEFWKERYREEGRLGHTHFEQFYTTAFHLSRQWYENKRVLDIGCGPRGSLEWADMASERVGLDPLADEYLNLGANLHKMSYVRAPSDDIPFPDDYFDVVTSFNSLDHVDNLEKTIAEIVRVTKEGGSFLLIVEVNHPPTPTEPLTIEAASLLRSFTPRFSVTGSWRCAMRPGTHDIYGSVLANMAPASDREPSILCALLTKESPSDLSV